MSNNTNANNAELNNNNDDLHSAAWLSGHNRFEAQAPIFQVLAAELNVDTDFLRSAARTLVLDGFVAPDRSWAPVVVLIHWTNLIREAAVALLQRDAEREAAHQAQRRAELKARRALPPAKGTRGMPARRAAKRA
jgi:hypothetical protein